MARFLAEVLPKVGPLKVLVPKLPPKEGERLLRESFTTSVEDYRTLLAGVGTAAAPEDVNLDLGPSAKAGEYSLADEAYSALLLLLSKKGFGAIPPDLKKDILSFYGDLSAPIATKQDEKRWKLTLHALEQLKDLDMEIIIAGPVDAQLRESIRSADLHQVRLLGDVPHEKAIALQKGCSLLLLIGNATSFQLPLKTFEYLGAKRPILCIRNGENDLVAGLVEPLRRGLVVENRPECIAAAIRGAYDLWKYGQLDAQFNLGDLDDFTWSHAGAKLHSILSDLG